MNAVMISNSFHFILSFVHEYLINNVTVELNAIVEWGVKLT